MVTRRRLLISMALVASLALASGLTRPAAATADGARDFIQSLGDATVAALADRSLSKEARIEKLSRLFGEGFDVRTISFFALGRHWRAASKPQLREYVRLFDSFIVRTYAARIGEYEGETLNLKGTRSAGSRDVIVVSEITRPSGPPIRVDWRVRKKKNGYKIVDVMVEGISMLITQRDEFAAVIRANGGQFEGLLSALREKSATH